MLKSLSGTSLSEEKMSLALRLVTRRPRLRFPAGQGGRGREAGSGAGAERRASDSAVPASGRRRTPSEVSRGFPHACAGPGPGRLLPPESHRRARFSPRVPKHGVL